MFAGQEKLKGVFSTEETRKVGTGTTTKKSVYKVFWFTEMEEDGRISIMPINDNFVPSGKKKYITEEELLEKYSPEPEVYQQSVYPQMRELGQILDKADTSREKGELFSAEFEYERALSIDLDNVRANFGIGLTYLGRGDNDKALDIFSRLVRLDAAFTAEHKHLFNDFGIHLRKNKMFEQALEYYQKAMELESDDDHLLINIARVHFEMKNVPLCLEHLVKALKVFPDSETGLLFMSWLKASKLVTDEDIEKVNEALG